MAPSILNLWVIGMVIAMVVAVVTAVCLMSWRVKEQVDSFRSATRKTWKCIDAKGNEVERTSEMDPEDALRLILEHRARRIAMFLLLAGGLAVLTTMVILSSSKHGDIPPVGQDKELKHNVESVNIQTPATNTLPTLATNTLSGKLP